ncbi:hypothetical protein DL767_010363 [Monosporascus sp. MG133]|nr:hypothetical protein DL767_010363 [Monosporascus sp. MG133]
MVPATPARPPRQRPAPALARPLAVRLVAALEAGNRPAEVRRLRAAVRALLEKKNEEEKKEQQAPAVGGAGVRGQVLALVGQILDLLLPPQQQQ